MDKQILFDFYFRDFAVQTGFEDLELQKAKGKELCEKYKDVSDLEFIRIMYEQIPELKYIENINNRYRLKRIDISLYLMKVVLIIWIVIIILAGLVWGIASLVESIP
jgi:hypothetical protein